MALVPYATKQQLADWLDAAGMSLPDNPDGYLRSATFRVAQACNISPYSGAAGDSPLADAVCAQVASWVALGVDPNKNGLDLPGPVRQSSILDAKVVRDTTALNALTTEMANGLCGEAEAILRQAELLWLGDFEIAAPACGPPEMAEFDGYGWPALSEWPYGW